eukprot:TRINITY_DN13408_c0_g1_i2.p1 TRINITY_DN13408_c0_g1~~TRINITY_DN13408_c0_g1_i2.p1  ORF type:complete len:161 (-),score=36.71 TRINITY_DN13408_c0_g1_i2:198-680(-)
MIRCPSFTVTMSLFCLSGVRRIFCSFFFFFLMIRRPPRSTQGVSSAASDVYKRQVSTQSTWAPFFRLVYVAEQPFQLSDICQHNLEDAKSVFAIYDEFNCGSIPAEALIEVFSDMGFSFASDPSYTIYFSKIIDSAKKVSSGYVNFEDFVRIHNELIDQL